MLRGRGSVVGLAIAFGLAAAASRAEDLPGVLDAPLAGWRYHGLTDHPEDARVAYPTPPIDRGGQRGRTLIEGGLQRLAGTRRPGTLAVNGNPLPLHTDEAGRFVRPYAFGAGSNSLALVGGDGQVVARRQFYEANTHRTPVRIRIVLGWDDPNAEIDLHVVTPDGQHAFWAEPVMSNGGGLDTDSVDGPGPEMFTMTAPLRGSYAVYVNYWGNLGAGGYNFDDGSNVGEIVATQITLVFNENTPNEKRETFLVPLRSIGELQLVKAFRY